MRTLFVVLLLALLASPVPAASQEQGEYDTDQIEVGSNPYVAGDAFQFLSTGKPGELAVVSIGFDEFREGAAVVLNRTGEPVIVEEVVVIASQADGQLFGIAKSLLRASAMPRLIADGAVGLVPLYFPGGSSGPLPNGLEFEYDFTLIPTSDDVLDQFVDLEITEASLQENRLVGRVHNASGVATRENSVAVAICFDRSGDLIESDTDATVPDMMAPGATGAFQLTINSECEHFLVTVKALR